MAKKILVTGGNSGIGLALCTQLAVEHGCHVFMGSRNIERGEAAVKSIAIPEGCGGSVQLVEIDVGTDSSVQAAASSVKAALGDDTLAAIVNNAGIGLAVSSSTDETINTNLYGPKRVCEAFGPILSPTEGRIVNVGSGSGPSYVSNCPKEVQPMYCTEPVSWAQVESWLTLSADGKTGKDSEADSSGGYGLSKALLASYTMVLAKENPQWLVSCCTPGFIDTKIVAGFGATKPPAEGTVAIKHCLFDELGGNGWYYGSDGERSPFHFMRSPGEPIYDGSGVAFKK
jgi:NAD(P)-dependent dehydrogenase (short-subunit alcohol dehydrogenase family)